ncbi:MAG TPA: hypothetical protein VNH84_00150 [Candidatus Saccharimonadales bacterium]|nr:hypothetical protein [Candidatus Saccharimonadales bacterium]
MRRVVTKSACRAGRKGAVLLEVVLALVLFVAAATVIGGAIHAALEGVQRQRLRVHAINLAATVLAELQLGLRSPAAAGPEPFPAPFTDWTWQLAIVPREDATLDGPGLTVVEVIVRHDDPPLVHRLAQGLKLEKRSTLAVAALPDSGRNP